MKCSNCGLIPALWVTQIEDIRDLKQFKEIGYCKTCFPKLTRGVNNV